MKFVFFGYDFMVHAVQRLLHEGHELCGIITFECDNVFTFNRDLIALGERLGVPVSLAKPALQDIENFIQAGCNCFLAAGYPHKIPAIDESRAYAINVHPSLLPQGRGLMPTPSIIIDHAGASGFSIHKITAGFDEGDILYQEALPLNPRETVETLSARIAMVVPEALSRLMKDLPDAWKNAKQQDHKKATYFKAPDETMRTLDWSKGVEHIDRTARAFGRYGSLARFDGGLWIVYSLDAWAEKHDLAPGSVACVLSREIVIAAKDGFVCLKEFQRMH